MITPDTVSNGTAIIDNTKPGNGTGDVVIEPEVTVKAGLDPIENHFPVTRPFKRNYLKVGRNELCPCGSKLKFKWCHGRNA